MKILPTPIAPGTYKISVPDAETSMLQNFCECPSELLQSICKYLAGILGLEYVNHTIYDYALLIERGKPISGGSSIWHNDSDGSGMDCILMIYNVVPDLDAATGMRVGYRDLTETKFVDIKNGDAFLHRQDQPHFQHKVEDQLGPIDYRACLSINMKGITKILDQLELGAVHRG